MFLSKCCVGPSVFICVGSHLSQTELSAAGRPDVCVVEERTDLLISYIRFSIIHFFPNYFSSSHRTEGRN